MIYEYDYDPLTINNPKIKKELYEFYGGCQKCQKSKDIKELDLDHKIPLILDGNSSNKDNVWLLCKNCHREKTYNDRLIWGFFNKIGITNTLTQTFFTHPINIWELYSLISLEIERSKR